MLETQMFNRFVEDRNEFENDPTFLFFDESISAKLNRSRKKAISHFGRGKLATPFLNDSSKAVSSSVEIHHEHASCLMV
jgi:hypothetical protein